MSVAPASIGHNKGPELSPYERIKEKIESLYEEALAYLDGEAIATQGQADDVSNLMNMLRDAREEADEARKEENKPFDEGKAAVQAKYAPLIADTKSVKGKTVLAVEACKKALAPWLQKLDEEKRAAAEKARLEAEEKQRIAQEAIRSAQAADLASREAAEQQLQEAKKAEAAAKKAEADRGRAGGGVGRKASLRTYYIAEIHDLKEFTRYVWANYQDDMRTYLNQRAQWMVDQGKRDIPGITVREDRRPV